MLFQWYLIYNILNETPLTRSTKNGTWKNWCIANKNYSDGFKFCSIAALQLMGECVEKWSVFVHGNSPGSRFQSRSYLVCKLIGSVLEEITFKLLVFFINIWLSLLKKESFTLRTRWVLTKPIIVSNKIQLRKYIMNS